MNPRTRRRCLFFALLLLAGLPTMAVPQMMMFSEADLAPAEGKYREASTGKLTCGGTCSTQMCC